MPQRKFDGGDAAALLCHYYHLKPWELDDLEDAQRDLLLSRVGLIRYYNDLPYLQKMFGAIDDEGIEKIISGESSPKASRRALAWDLWALKQYGLLAEEGEDEGITALTALSPEAAEGLVRWWESGDLYRLPDGAEIWRVHLAGIYRQLIKRADELKP